MTGRLGETEPAHSILRSTAPGHSLPPRDIALRDSCCAPAPPPKLSRCQVAHSVAAESHRRPASLRLSLIGRLSRRRARGRELPAGSCRFEIVCSEILPSVRPTFWSRPERQKACCLRHLRTD